MWRGVRGWEIIGFMWVRSSGFRRVYLYMRGVDKGEDMVIFIFCLGYGDIYRGV